MVANLENALGMELLEIIQCKGEWEEVQKREKFVGSCKRAVEILEQEFPPISTSLLLVF